jgi:poly(3-hydroxyalkanoate) depolymerase
MNGIGAQVGLLTPFVEAMHEACPDLEIITYDSIGVGRSSTPSLPYRFSGLSKTVSQMLDTLDVAQVYVLGLSFGGFLAQEFARQHPQRCKKLILAATCAGVISIPPSMKVLSMMASPRRYTDPEYAKEVLPEIYGGKYRHDKKLLEAHIEKMADRKPETEQSKRGYLYQQGCVIGWSSLWWLHSLKQPTLVLSGLDDPLIHPVNIKVMANLIPNAELHTFEDGHLFLITSVDKVTPIIKEFLS